MLKAQDLTVDEIVVLRRIVDGGTAHPTVRESVALARLINAGFVDVKKIYSATVAGVELSRTIKIEVGK